MSHQAYRILSYLISSVIVLGAYSIYLFQRYQDGAFDSDGISKDWGKTLLILIGIQVLANIVFSIIASILYSIRYKEAKPDIEDERDHIFDMKAARISFGVFGVGFLLAMVALAMGWTPLAMLHIILYALFGAGIIGYIVQLYLYKRGF